LVLDIVGLQISVPELIWTVICFFLLLFLLNRFLYKPILKVMDERSAKIAEGMDAGKKAAEAMLENDALLAAELSEKGSDARKLISEARDGAEKEKSQLILDARKTAEGISKAVREKVSLEETATVGSMENDMPEFVALLSEKLLGSDEVSKDAGLINECITASKDRTDD